MGAHGGEHTSRARGGGVLAEIRGELTTSLGKVRKIVRRGAPGEPMLEPEAPPPFVPPPPGDYQPLLADLTKLRRESPLGGRHARPTQPNLVDRIEKKIENAFDKI